MLRNITDDLSFMKILTFGDSKIYQNSRFFMTDLAETFVFIIGYENTYYLCSIF
jgi:hypothetical protein